MMNSHDTNGYSPIPSASNAQATVMYGSSLSAIVALRVSVMIGSRTLHAPCMPCTQPYRAPCSRLQQLRAGQACPMPISPYLADKHSLGIDRLPLFDLCLSGCYPLALSLASALSPLKPCQKLSASVLTDGSSSNPMPSTPSAMARHRACPSPVVPL